MYTFDQNIHLGSSLSAVEIVTAVLFKHIRSCNSKDWFVLSKGHAAPVLYAALIELGMIPREEMRRIQAIDGILQGHPEIHVEGVDVSSGSLGQAFSVAVGIAMAIKLKREEGRVYVIMGDGEQDEGEVWEAMNNAAKLNLSNLIVIIDENDFQLDGHVEDIRPKHYLPYVWHAVGWDVFMCNGHDIASLDLTLEKAENSRHPSVIFARTIRGKGLKSIENTKIQKPDLNLVKPILENA